MIWGDQSAGDSRWPVLEAEPGATIIADVKASQILFDRTPSSAANPLMWRRPQPIRRR